MDWYSFTIYFAVLFFSLIFSLNVKKSKTKDEEFLWRFFVFIILLLPAILRYNLGADYASYENMYYNSAYRKAYAEIGFNGICNLLQMLGLSAWWLFFVFAFLTYFVLSFFVAKKNFVCTIAFYILFSGYFRSLDQIRQSLALPFLLLAIGTFVNRKILKTIAYILCGSLFHTSSLLFFLLLPICIIHISIKNRLFIIAVFIFVILKINLQESITSFLFLVFPRYARLMDKGTASIGSGFGLIANCIFPFMFIISKMDTKSKFIKRELDIGKNFSMIYILLFFLTAKIAIFNRLRDFVWVAILYLIPKLPKSKYRTLIYLIIFILGFLIFFRSIQIQHGSGSNQIVPYITIFEK